MKQICFALDLLCSLHNMIKFAKFYLQMLLTLVVLQALLIIELSNYQLLPTIVIFAIKICLFVYLIRGVSDTIHFDSVYLSSKLINLNSV